MFLYPMMSIDKYFPNVLDPILKFYNFIKYFFISKPCVLAWNRDFALLICKRINCNN